MNDAPDERIDEQSVADDTEGLGFRMVSEADGPDDDTEGHAASASRGAAQGRAGRTGH